MVFDTSKQEGRSTFPVVLGAGQVIPGTCLCVCACVCVCMRACVCSSLYVRCCVDRVNDSRLI